jgi:hypothetical protein
MLQPFGEVYLYSHFENGYPAGGRIEEVRLFAVVAGSSCSLPASTS